MRAFNLSFKVIYILGLSSWISLKVPHYIVILFSFGINSNITYSTKHINSHILNT